MTEDEKKGQKRLLIVLGAVILIDILTMLYYVVVLGTYAMFMGQLIRLLMMLVFMYFTYEGKTWAKTILTVLLGLGIARGLYSVYLSLSDPENILQIILLTAFYATIFYLLIWGKFITKYFNYQKKLNSTE